MLLLLLLQLPVTVDSCLPLQLLSQFMLHLLVTVDSNLLDDAVMRNETRKCTSEKGTNALFVLRVGME